MHSGRFFLLLFLSAPCVYVRMSRFYSRLLELRRRIKANSLPLLAVLAAGSATTTNLTSTTTSTTSTLKNNNYNNNNRTFNNHNERQRQTLLNQGDPRTAVTVLRAATSVAKRYHLNGVIGVPLSHLVIVQRRRHHHLVTRCATFFTSVSLHLWASLSLTPFYSFLFNI